MRDAKGSVVSGSYLFRATVLSAISRHVFSPIFVPIGKVVFDRNHERVGNRRTGFIDDSTFDHFVKPTHAHQNIEVCAGLEIKRFREGAPTRGTGRFELSGRRMMEGQPVIARSKSLQLKCSR